MDDQFLNDMNAIANRIQSHADSEDGRRIAQIAQHILDHNWDEANALLASWSVKDERDYWGDDNWEVVEDPFDGGCSYVN